MQAPPVRFVVLSLIQSVLTGALATIVQLFQWDWDSVAKECTDFIGPAGMSTRGLIIFTLIYSH